MQALLNNEVLKASINTHFGEIEDPRAERTRAHYLVDIIVITLFAVISGADSWVGIETYGNSKQEWLKQFLALPNRIPSHDTFARVFARLDPERLEVEFRNWVQTIAGELSAQVIAIDGKTSRGSYDREKGIKDRLCCMKEECKMVLYCKGEKMGDKYRVKNWSEYDAGLKQRGSLTFWVNEEVLKSWVEEEKTGKQGASPKYSDQAIITMMTIKRVMGLARRQTEGFVESLFMLMGVD